MNAKQRRKQKRIDSKFPTIVYEESQQGSVKEHLANWAKFASRDKTKDECYLVDVDNISSLNVVSNPLIELTISFDPDKNEQHSNIEGVAKTNSSS